MTESNAHICEVNRNGATIEVSYSDVVINISGNESASVKAEWIDNLGNKQRERIALTFPGAAADTLRAQIIAGIDARIQNKFGN